MVGPACFQAVVGFFKRLRFFGSLECLLTGLLLRFKLLGVLYGF